MAIRVGCTGWSYEDWRGPFYPTDAPPNEYLERYAQVFDYTEVDSSFYGPPSVDTTRRWIESTPDGFLFSLKLPGAISHEKRLRGFEEPLQEFLQGVGPLRERARLAPLVLQLPPTLSAPADREALEAFLRSWPTSLRLAIEFRHGSWFTPSTYDLLRDHRCALVWSVTQYGEAPTVDTTDFRYVRFVGDRQLTRFDRVQRDLSPIVSRWSERIVGRKDQDAYVVVNNHFMGFAPQTARIALRALGLPDVDLERARRRRHQAGLREFLH